MAKFIPVSVSQPKVSDFSTVINQKKTSLHVLENVNEMSVGLTNYGARIVSLKVPDRNGKIGDVVLGYDTILEYLHSMDKYFGATCGRFANRISKGRFKLGKNSYQLELNDPPNHLHGGLKGYHNVIWDINSKAKNQVIYKFLSEDGDSGYPGTLEVEVSFTLSSDDELIINYRAVSEETTVINLTNHAYFNLSGAGSGDVGKHILYLDADEFTPINSKTIPTGEVKGVKGTPFDFRIEKPIGKDWDADDEQLTIVGGYDHNFVLNKEKQNELRLAARVIDPISGRILEVETTEPGIQFYTANALTGKDIGREGEPYKPRTAFCLETQHFPDSPNKPEFPSVILEPGKIFQSTTIYRFKHD